MRHTTLELAARVGVKADRIRDWTQAGHLTPLNPKRLRRRRHGEPFMYGRKAIFSAAMGRLADDASLGWQSVMKIVRFCDRADLKKHFEEGMTLLMANKGHVKLVHRDAHVFSRGPITLCVFDLAGLWQKFTAQMDKLEAEEAAESSAAGRARCCWRRWWRPAMPKFEVVGQMPIGRVLSPLARLLRGAARRDRLMRAVVQDINAGLRGQELLDRVEVLMAALCRPAA